MVNSRDFKGIWIPKEIWLSKKLSVIEKLFLVEIDSLDNEEGCYANNEHFANFFELSKNRCSEIIKSLEKKRRITIKYYYKKGSKAIDKRVIKINKNYGIAIEKTPSESRTPYSENRLTPSENRLTPSENRLTPSENCEDNNTVNNTVNNTINYNNYSGGSSQNKIDVMKHYEKCGFLYTPMLLEKISADIEIYGEQWLKDAAEVAMTRGKLNNYSYVQGILQNWKTKGRSDAKGDVQKNGIDERGEELRQMGIGL